MSHITDLYGKANSQSNCKGKFRPPWSFKNPEEISMKLGIYNYVANPHGAVTTWVVWANT